MKSYMGGWGVSIVLALGCTTAPEPDPNASGSDSGADSTTRAEDESTSGASADSSSGELPDDDSGDSGDSSDSGSDSTGTTQPPPECDRSDAPGLEATNLDPFDTDPDISDGFAHVWVEPGTTPVDRLFVFLPGTGGPAIGYREVLRNAAAGGYHALGLSYQNAVAVNDLCTVMEPGCHADVRWEILTGEDTSALIEVSRADSIENRLVRALEYLGWTDYLDGDAPRWDRIAFAGHSQGAGHSAFIAGQHEVYRAVLFAGTEPADWTQQAGPTPPERMYGFIHTQDGQYGAIVNSWANLGLPGELVDVDTMAPDYGGSHRLETSLAEDGGNPHGSIVTHIYTPIEDGQPVYADVWCTLVGP